MNKDIKYLCILAAFITSDNFKETEKCIILMKKRKIDPLKIYETILQTYLFCGFPAVIESLKIFKFHFKNFTITYQTYDLKKYQKAGLVNCKLIYKKNFKKLISNMAFVSPELKEWMIIEGYGKILGRKGLTLAERELINVSILTTRYFESQLFAHFKGSLNLDIKASFIIKILDEIKAISGNQNYNKACKLLKHISLKSQK